MARERCLLPNLVYALPMLNLSVTRDLLNNGFTRPYCKCQTMESTYSSTKSGRTVIIKDQYEPAVESRIVGAILSLFRTKKPWERSSLSS
jgi:hypothetical protein